MIQIPERLRDRPRDHRGNVVLFTTAMTDGKPDFRAIDSAKVTEAVDNRLCGICGQRLEYWITFIGGPISARTRAFADPGMHPECSAYALQVCPYLLYRDKPRARPPDGAVAGPGFNPEKADHLTLTLARDYKVVPTTPPHFVIIAKSVKEVRVIEYSERSSE